MFDLMSFDQHNNRLFQPFADLERSLWDGFGNLEREFPCKTDILDEGDHYLVKADLPGFSKEDIRVDINGDRLTISAEHKEETEEKNDNFLRRERRYGSLSRSFDLTGVDAQRISANYQDGVLQLTLPKKPETTPPSRRIEIG